MQRWSGTLSVDLIIADPPYNIGYEYDIYKDNKPDEEYLDWTHQWVSAAAKLLKPDGSLWVAIGDEYAAEVKWIAQRKVGLHLRNWVIWYYTFGVLCRDKFSRSHTHLLYFVKDPNAYKFRAERIRVPSARRLVYNDTRSHPAGRVPDNTWILRPQDVPVSFTAREDTWYFARVAGTFKERAGFVQCQFPEKLLGRIILACSDPGDLVFDPFVGSGSSLVVAKKLGRHWLGCELSPNYARWAESRIRLANVGDALEGPEDPLISAPSTPAYFQKSQFTKPELQHLHNGVLGCFLRVHEGYSVDRLLADPVLQARFWDACSVARLPGRPVDWNLALLRLRKSRKIPTKGYKRTTLPQLDLDAIAYAAEMALRRLLDQGFPSLDYILADPGVTIRFDCLARRLAPGVPTLYYRWAALHLRKRARALRERGTARSRELPSAPTDPIALQPENTEGFSHVPALYYIQQRTGRERQRSTVYIGQTLDIAKTLANLAQVKERIAALCRRPGDLYIAVVYVGSGLSYMDMGALRYQEARRLRPELNYLGARGVAETSEPAEDSTT